MSSKANELRGWTVADSLELYQIPAWGNGYFSVNAAGNVIVHPDGPAGNSIELFKLVEDLRTRGYELPILLRFSDILRVRVAELAGAFGAAIGEYGYRGSYRPVYPIKVNQARDVVEELVDFGRDNALGLEAGSKPELLVALAHVDSPDALIVCNGFKDRGYIETALLAQKLGRHPIIVVDRLVELEAILDVSRRLDLRPHIGVRARLNTKGAGKWLDSTGDRSKFGLSAEELVAAVRQLEDAGMLDCLELMHFHIGSQITAIRAVKDALREARRVFVELCGLGAGLKFIDVGGGLAVDYDGSQTNFHSSRNYTLQEYANDVVSAIQDACDEKGIPHPDIISESGRALVAHHALLVVDVLGESQVDTSNPAPECADHEAHVVRELYSVWNGLSAKNFLEGFHDALQIKEEAGTLFSHGMLGLETRALVDKLFWAVCRRLIRLTEGMSYVPEELETVDRALRDIYYCNFSVFQSMPDHWAVEQLFPIVPLHRLHERPSRRAILADLTCDSDGMVDQFIDLRGVKHALELHPLRDNEPYYLGMFLIGAYQEILGDLHNLFGDTHVVHVSLHEGASYELERVVEGDSVTEVLGYVQYGRQDLVSRVRRAAEAAVRRGQLSLEESTLLLRRYHEGLAGYTYLSKHEVDGG